VWTANFEDGSSATSKSTFWTQLPKDKKMTGLQLRHPLLPNLYLNLSNMDQFYFVTEAIQFMSSSNSETVVAEVIGGVDLELKIVTEIRLDYTGSVKVRTKSIDSYNYSKDILIPGLKKEKVVSVS
jgi:hypothetical protein